MPSFKDINDVPVRKLSDSEILHALQAAIASEYETFQIYQRVLDGTDNTDVRGVMNDLLDDAMHHAGALLKLLYRLSPELARQYEIGAQRALKDMGIRGLVSDK